MDAVDETLTSTTRVTLEQVPAQAGGTFPLDGEAAAGGAFAQTGSDVLAAIAALVAIAIAGVALFALCCSIMKRKGRRI